MSFEFKVMESPVGKLKLVARDNKLVAILWENDRPNRVKLGDMREVGDNPVLLETARQLGEYFAGKRTRFDLDIEFCIDTPVSMQGADFLWWPPP
jgi:methylated-DNA-[protein]-cysteine S-methyltransferase